VKSGRQKGGQDLSQEVNDLMRHVLRTRHQLEDGNKRRAVVDSQPQTQQVFVAAQPGAQFVQLKVRELEVGEAAPMQDLRMLESRGTARR
jgi:hypothetical protein